MTVLNLLSSPGSGKTTLLEETVARLRGGTNCGVVVGDCATDKTAGACVLEVSAKSEGGMSDWLAYFEEYQAG